MPKIEKKIYVSHTTYLQKRVQLKCISHKSNASRKMSTNFSFTFKTPDTLLSHYKKTCLATVELLYWIRLCLIIRLISIKWYIVWNRKIIFALKWYRIAVFCHKYSQKCSNSIQDVFWITILNRLCTRYSYSWFFCKIFVHNHWLGKPWDHQIIFTSTAYILIPMFVGIRINNWSSD